MSNDQSPISPRNQSLEWPSHYPKLMASLEKAKNSFSVIEPLHRAMLHNTLLKLCGLAKELIENHLKWRDYLRACWTGTKPPKVSDQPKALYHVLRWVCGTTTAALQKASFYYRALGPLLEQGLKRKQIKRALVEKGLRTLADEHANHRPTIAKKKVVVFGARKRGGVWHLPAKLRFDHEPLELKGFTGDRYFTMNGRFKAVGDGCEITAFSIKMSDVRYD